MNPRHFYEAKGNITTPQTLKAVFLCRVVKDVNVKGCWAWIGAKDGVGYGMMRVCGVVRRASHLSLELFKNLIVHTDLDEGALHTCDNKWCVNPEHLYVGDSDQNAKDRAASGRTAKGERNGAYTQPWTRRTGQKNGRAKIAPTDVLVIRATLQSYAGKRGVTSALARRYGLDCKTIAEIGSGKLWASEVNDRPELMKPLDWEDLNITGKQGIHSKINVVNDQEVREIRYIYEKCEGRYGTVKKLAKHYKLSRTQLLRIALRESWDHVIDDPPSVRHLDTWFGTNADGQPIYHPRDLTFGGTCAGAGEL